MDVCLGGEGFMSVCLEMSVCLGERTLCVYALGRGLLVDVCLGGEGFVRVCLENRGLVSVCLRRGLVI